MIFEFRGARNRRRAASLLRGSFWLLIGLSAGGAMLRAQTVDLSISVSAPATVTVNTNFSYTITVSSVGAASGVTVTAILPVGVTFVAAGSSPGCTDNAGTVTCPVSILPATLTIVAKATMAGLITNVVGVVGNEYDNAMSNNSAQATTVVSAALPTVTVITPRAGPAAGGRPVTITGTNFQSGATVTIGGVAATGVTFVNSTTLTATTPSHSAGAASVVVTNPGGAIGTLSNGYTFFAPAIFADDPIIAQFTPVRAQHIYDLRAVIDALRAAAGLPPGGWTGTSLVGQTVLAVHVQQLRDNLNQALNSLGYSTSGYTDPSLPAFMIRKIHIDQLRDRVRAVTG